MIHFNYLLHQLEEYQSFFIEGSDLFHLYWNISGLKLLIDEKDISETQEQLKKLFDNTKHKLEHRISFLFENKYNFAINLCNLYAAISLYKILDLKISDKLKDSIIDFLFSIKKDDGSFLVYENGELDVRGIYTALVILELININGNKNIYFRLIKNCTKYLLTCQSYEGGFSGTPGTEAHGGYTYCAVAALSLLNSLEFCKINLLVEWLYCRIQYPNTSFNGRTNKDMDSCYGFWIGSCYKIINDYLKLDICFDKDSVRKYILNECQDLNGGFRNKEDNKVDLHHTCYALFFLAIYDDQNVFSFTVDPVLGIVIEKMK